MEQVQGLAAASRAIFKQARIDYWNETSGHSPTWSRVRSYYRRRLIEIYSFIVPRGMRVLELGCGAGDLLSAVAPSRGVGLDIAPAMVAEAKARHPALHVVEADAETHGLDERFDYILASDLLNELWDVQAMLERLLPLCHPQTRLLLNVHSNLWQSPRWLAVRLGLARPQMAQNWLTPEDVTNLLHLAGFEVIRWSSELLWPLRTPGWDALCNRVLVRLWPFYLLGLTNLVIARPVSRAPLPEAIVSVVVPARNEAGNVAEIFDRVPAMGRGTELIFVEGGSTDDTYGAIEREMAVRQRALTQLLRQTGKGKGDAVRLGFAHATGEVLMILDADLTVAPEDLPRFYEAWRSSKGDCINGVRMVYPMGERAMRFANLVGNKAFSLAFSYLLGQRVKDTACGTKVLSRTHYALVATSRAQFGNLDRFGDWDLLLGAAKFNLKIVDMPIRYHERVYGQTKMQRWRIGWLLLRMVVLGLWRLKFV